MGRGGSMSSMGSICSKGWSEGLNRFAGLKSQSENEIESEFPQLTFFFILIQFLALNKNLRAFVPSCLRVKKNRVYAYACLRVSKTFVALAQNKSKFLPFQSGKS